MDDAHAVRVGEFVFCAGQIPLDPATGQLTYLTEMQGIDSPSFLAVDHQQRYLYALSEVEEGTVSAYAIHRDTGGAFDITSTPLSRLKSVSHSLRSL